MSGQVHVEYHPAVDLWMAQWVDDPTLTVFDHTELLATQRLARLWPSHSLGITPAAWEELGRELERLDQRMIEAG